MIEPGHKVTVSTLSGSYESEVIEVTPGGFVVRSPKGARVTVKGARVRSNEPKLHQRTPLERPANYDMTPGVAVPKSPPEEDPAYLDFVREHDCCGCGKEGPSDPHHWASKGHGEGGASMKHDDRRTVPLCRGCHDMWHDHRHLPIRAGSTVFMTRVLTERMFLETQTDLLIEWIRKNAAR